jgi:SAM-dependent methyltransferase
LYIADKYRTILAGSVLDVGCDCARLRALVADPGRYVGVDRGPEADVRLDLDRDVLPFADRSFDLVLATDVLEHLERCHAVLDDLCRVASQRVLVSLPNPLQNLIHHLARGTGGAGLKYYGLPTEVPPDRHRWFFGAEEAARFVRERASRNGFEVEQLDFEDSGLPSLRTRDGANLCEHPNLRCGTMWCVLVRTGEGHRP